jgi:hypothetical protein
VRFGNTIQLARHRWPRSALQGSIPLTHEPLANPDDLPLGETDCHRDFMVRSAPTRMPIIGEK